MSLQWFLLRQAPQGHSHLPGSSESQRERNDGVAVLPPAPPNQFQPCGIQPSCCDALHCLPPEMKLDSLFISDPC